MSSFQRTLRGPVVCEGVGLHSGQRVSLRMMPARPDTGVVFVRTDLSGKPMVRAVSAHVVDTSLSTTLGVGDVRVQTVEHVLAAIVGLGIDNVRIELDGSEVPIMDGSSVAFVQMLLEAGVRDQEATRSMLVIKKTVTVRDGDKFASIAPGKGLRIQCAIDFRHPLISDQTMSFVLSEKAFIKEVGRARTFGFLRDVEMLKEMGLAKGGTLSNAIVVDDFSILNPEGLRFPDEFVRHKVLDALGDLSLLGLPVSGHLVVHKAGHALHHKLVTAILSDAAHYAIVKARAPEGLRAPGFLDDLDGDLTPSAA